MNNAQIKRTPTKTSSVNNYRIKLRGGQKPREVKTSAQPGPTKSVRQEVARWKEKVIPASECNLNPESKPFVPFCKEEVRVNTIVRQMTEMSLVDNSGGDVTEEVNSADTFIFYTLPEDKNTSCERMIRHLREERERTINDFTRIVDNQHDQLVKRFYDVSTLKFEKFDKGIEDLALTLLEGLKVDVLRNAKAYLSGIESMDKIKRIVKVGNCVLGKYKQYLEAKGEQQGMTPEGMWEGFDGVYIQVMEEMDRYNRFLKELGQG